MDVIPEVRALGAQLTELLGGQDLLAHLDSVVEVAQRLVPSCVGVSVTLLVDGDPYTVTATSPELREVDAAQYLDGGPCPAAALEEELVSVPDVLDEQRWHAFAQASAARGIRATLSVPLRLPDWTVCGSLNLYASDPGAFSGTEEVLTQVFGHPVAGAVANADLSFRTREQARRLPAQLADKATLDQATGVMMHRRGWTARQARERIRTAALGAGISDGEAAAMVISLGV